MGKRVVILGAGYAGVIIAKGMEKKIRKQKIQNVEITLIDKNPYHTMLTELHEVAACRVPESSICMDLKKMFAGRNVNVVLDEITDANYAGNKLTGKTGKTYEYDYLVMASGCKSTYFGIKGAEENTFPLWSNDEAVRLRDQIHNSFRSAAQEPDPAKRRALLTFYIIGAGFTGVEMAGELAEYAPTLCREFKIDREEVTIVMVDGLDRIMPALPDKARNRVMKRFEKIGVEVVLKTFVTGVTKNSIELSPAGGGETKSVPTCTVVWAAGTEGSDIAMKSEALGIVPRTRGRIQTDKYLRSLEHPNVYVAGDNVFYVPEGEKDPVPQMVENAEHGAPLIMDNILTEIAGGKPSKEYKPQFHGMMVCIGGRYATAYGGMPGKFFVSPSFFAHMAKHLINFLHYINVLGLYKVINYARQEFFTVRDKRSFLGGHFSNRAPTFFIVPLRIYLAYYFIYTAYVRTVHQFLDVPQLLAMFENIPPRFAFMNFWFMDFTILDRIGFLFFQEGGQNTLWLRTSPMAWFLETWVVATPSQELFWQYSIVILELILGLMFLGGLFTTLASIGALCTMGLVMLTVGLPYHMWWIMFASIACMFTAGRAFSLDYYVLPWLKARWKKLSFVKKWYLYVD